MDRAHPAYSLSPSPNIVPSPLTLLCAFPPHLADPAGNWLYWHPILTSGLTHLIPFPPHLTLCLFPSPSLVTNILASLSYVITTLANGAVLAKGAMLRGPGVSGGSIRRQAGLAPGKVGCAAL